MPTLEQAARAIIAQRDHHAEHQEYAKGELRPADDQSFDDWAADLLEMALDGAQPGRREMGS